MTEGLGIHLALNRDLAKQLFADRAPGAARRFVSELCEQMQGEQVQCRTQDWRELHALLEQRAPLELCFLGGRPIDEADAGGGLRLVRPDLTPRIADSLGELRRDELDLDDRQWSQLSEVTRFFQAAAERRDAVVFWFSSDG